MILSIGYRVKSSRGVEFRRWANRVLKDLGKKMFAFTKLGIPAEAVKNVACRDRHLPFSRHHCDSGQPSHLGLRAVQV